MQPSRQSGVPTVSSAPSRAVGDEVNCLPLPTCLPIPEGFQVRVYGHSFGPGDCWWAHDITDDEGAGKGTNFATFERLRSQETKLGGRAAAQRLRGCKVKKPFFSFKFFLYLRLGPQRNTVYLEVAVATCAPRSPDVRSAGEGVVDVVAAPAVPCVKSLQPAGDGAVGVSAAGATQSRRA